ncbi:MAG: MFS transporter [Bryobacteraceae bacterium]|nr:MFS transporter [Bryobacteraceae bacterium]
MTENQLRYPGWRVAAAAAFGVFVSFSSVVVYTFGVFLKPLTETFGWSREAVSLAFAVAAMSVAVCSPFLGVLLDRYGPRKVILPCLSIFGLSFASLGYLTPNVWHMYGVFLMIGIVANGTAQMAYSRAVSTWFDQRRGLAFATLMTGGAIGAIVLPGVAQSLIRTVGWRSAYIFLGAGVLAFGLPVVALLIREQPDSRNSDATRGVEASVWEGLRSRAFWLIVGSLFLVSLGQNSAITHMPALLSDRGVASGSAAAAIAVLGAASLAGRLGTGWLLDRFHGPYVSLVLLLLAAAGVFLLSSAQSAWQGFVAAALIGVGLGGEADVTPYLISRYFGLKSFATLYGFTWTAYAIAGAIGPILMGRAFDMTRSYATVLTVLGVLTVCAAALMLLMPGYAGREKLRAASRQQASGSAA